MSLIERFNQYKLETEFYDGYVVHRTSEWKPSSSSRSWKTSTWEQKELIGHGGFGDVWLQEEKVEAGSGGQLRAVKILPRYTADVSQLQELLALVKLNRYNHLFVEFLGWFENAYKIFLAMEYVEHGDLGGYMKSAWAKAEVKEITRQILEGLEVLHGKRICHRDLKPQNILIASLDPVWIKIADFGVSKRLKGTSARTRIGTQGYIAPELLLAVPNGGCSNPYTLDIWSLGSVVYELLTSETPFKFIEPLYDLESGINAGSSDHIVDFLSLQKYCHGHIEFPTNVLQKSQVGEEEMTFVKSLLIANPNDRPTATDALQNPWLKSYTYTSSYVKKLKNEFSCLGLDLDLGDKENILMRQVGQGDIMRFFPNSAKVQVSSLLMEAEAKGYSSVISRLKSPNCGLESISRLSSEIQETFHTAARPSPTIGVFNTQEIRPWNLIWKKTSKTVSFSRPYPKPPCIAIGLTAVDIDRLSCARIGVMSFASNIYNERFEVNVDSWSDTKAYSVGCAWLEIEADDPDFQAGSYNTEDHSSNHRPAQNTRKVIFPRSYDSIPVVVVWLKKLDMANNRNWRVKTFASDITATGFTIHINMWSDSILYAAEATWVAYPSGKPGVYSGQFSTLDIRPSNQPQLYNSGYEKFSSDVFDAPPRTMLAINSLDIDQSRNMRLSLKASTVSETGMMWHLDAWYDTILYSAGASYLALS